MIGELGRLAAMEGPGLSVAVGPLSPEMVFISATDWRLMHCETVLAELHPSPLMSTRHRQDHRLALSVPAASIVVRARMARRRAAS